MKNAKIQKKKESKKEDVLLDFNKVEKSEVFQNALEKVIKWQDMKKWYLPKIVHYPSEDEFYEFINTEKFSDYFDENYKETFRLLIGKTFLVFIDGKKQFVDLSRSGGQPTLGFGDYNNQIPDFVIIKEKNININKKIESRKALLSGSFKISNSLIKNCL